MLLRCHFCKFGDFEISNCAAAREWGHLGGPRFGAVRPIPAGGQSARPEREFQSQDHAEGNSRVRQGAGRAGGQVTPRLWCRGYKRLFRNDCRSGFMPRCRGIVRFVSRGKLAPTRCQDARALDVAQAGERVPPVVDGLLPFAERSLYGEVLFWRIVHGRRSGGRLCWRATCQGIAAPASCRRGTARC